MFKSKGARLKVAKTYNHKRTKLSAKFSGFGVLRYALSVLRLHRFAGLPFLRFVFPSLIICSVLTILSILLVASASSSADTRGKPILWGFAIDGYPITQQKLKNVESETGLTSDITVFFLQWPPPGHIKNARFPHESLDDIWNRGSVPCITWEPMYYGDTGETMIHYKDILNGSYDSYITFFANQAKTWGKPFMIRFAHEMNLKRYHWGTDEKSYGKESPLIYKYMFRHVVSLFRKAGAYNVLWIFCPNAESVPNTSYDRTASWNIIKNYYPGDDYVDIMGIDGYNWGTTQKKEKNGWDSHWRTFKDIFKSARDELFSISPKKDIIIFETATVNQEGSKTLWIRQALETSKEWGVAGIVWFQSNKELDWRINSTEGQEYLSIIRTSTSASHEWVKKYTKVAVK